MTAIVKILGITHPTALNFESSTFALPLTVPVEMLSPATKVVFLQFDKRSDSQPDDRDV